jgi:selenocysteine lyase/cysteine desulfurase
MFFYSLRYRIGEIADPGSCEKTVQFLCDTVPGFSMVKVDLDYPISNEEIVVRTKGALSANSNVRLILMDAISSLPGVRFPWEEICALCRERKIYSLVDAAHAVTQIPVNIFKSDPDFFVSNLHKWSYIPRGCAVLYIRRELQSKIHSIPIGHGYISSTQPGVPSPLSTNPEGTWVSEHEWVGTQDWSGYLSVSAAFEFIERCGGAEKIREYCHSLAIEGGQIVAEILETEVLDADGGNMVNVRLPLDVPHEARATHAEELANQQEALFDGLFEHDCFPYPFVMKRAGRKEWWCRFSAQIYLDEDDFVYGANVLKKLCRSLQDVDFSTVVAKLDDLTV